MPACSITAPTRRWPITGTSAAPPYCKICLAGSLIAGRLNFPPDCTASSRSFDRVTEDKLNALNSIRLGVCTRAFKMIHKKSPSPRITELLRLLPKPLCSYFSGWPEFEARLDSLENLLPELRAIDKEALRL